MGLHVKTNRHHYIGERKETVNPGSVILLENDQAHDFVRRGFGVLCAGPAFDAPAPDDDGGFPRSSVERQDLSAKLHKAEKMTSPAQRAGAI